MPVRVFAHAARVLGATLAGLIVLLAGLATIATPARAAATIVGTGSSFAGIELQQWSADVAKAPYSLSVNWQNTDSGTARQEFYQDAQQQRTVDFGVTDIRYNKYDGQEQDPSTFVYIPVTAGGLAIMYNLQAHGLGTSAAPLKLSSHSLCGIFTTGIKYWDDTALQQDNPGVQLPHVPVRVVYNSGPAGTNWVLEEYCNDEQPAMYKAYVDYVNQSGAAGSAGALPDNEPTSTWPPAPGEQGTEGSDNQASAVADPNDDGFVTYVETGYAKQDGFPVASVANDTGNFVQPTDHNVFVALSYATQQSDGTHDLNFSPGDPSAYNPSTYSYMLVPLTGISTDKGQSLVQFAQYCLTIGQQEADGLGYASIGRQLEQWGLSHLQGVPGYVAPTTDETNAVAQAPSQASDIGGGTTVGTGGGSSAANSAGGGSSGASGTSSSGSAGSPGGSGATSRAAGGSRGVARTRAVTGGSVGGASSLGTVNPSVSLDPSVGPLGYTGVRADLLTAGGLVILALGELSRRLLRARAQRS